MMEYSPIDQQMMMMAQPESPSAAEDVAQAEEGQEMMMDVGPAPEADVFTVVPNKKMMLEDSMNISDDHSEKGSHDEDTDSEISPSRKLSRSVTTDMITKVSADRTMDDFEWGLDEDSWILGTPLSNHKFRPSFSSPLR
jgi:hypothetical protein